MTNMELFEGEPDYTAEWNAPAFPWTSVRKADQQLYETISALRHVGRGYGMDLVSGEINDEEFPEPVVFRKQVDKEISSSPSDIQRLTARYLGEDAALELSYVRDPALVTGDSYQANVWSDRRVLDALETKLGIDFSVEVL